MKCRFCKKFLTTPFIDLAFAPPSNALLTANDLLKIEKYYPLKTYVCNNCLLVQTEDYSDAKELFNSEYPYFSSTSRSWLRHAEKFSADIINLLSLGKNSLVVEIASNDGYLLKNFLSAGIPSIGIEPTTSTANHAEKIGISVIREFFTEKLAAEFAAKNKKADLIIGNNVYAHVPDIVNFTNGIKNLLKNNGVVTLEFPHLLRLIQGNQFDTIYHEHFSYLTLQVVDKIFQKSGLKIWRVDELTTHGGSLRLYGSHKGDERPIEESVKKIIDKEKRFELNKIETYLNRNVEFEKIKNNFLTFLIQQKNKGKKVAGYGAAAKGNTLLNYAGVKKDLIPFVYDESDEKQGKFLPGSHIPILSPLQMNSFKPDYLIIFPWNIASEIINSYSYIKEWGGQFVKVIPEIEIS